MIHVVHLTVCRALSSGQRKQIKYEAETAGALAGAVWTSLAIHNGPGVEAFERPMPRLFRPVLLRSLYGWIVALRLSRQYDFVLVRHMNFDPFVFVFAPLIPNRLSVHHAKEVEELPLIRPGITGRIASFIERLTGRFGVRRSTGVLGVTHEIARYERDTRAPGKPCSVYPNGISLATVDVIEDQRRRGEIHVVFICGTFTEWHGLDRLVAAVAQAPALPAGLVIHLIGKVTKTQHAQIDALGDRAPTFCVHGFLESSSYRGILAVADIGLGSLAMDRQNLREGATLKVREMLAMGLPVYSGHRDTMIPESFPYYHVQERTVDLRELEAFALRMKDVPRERVRDQSAPYIEKLQAMQSVVNWLRETYRQGSVAGATPAGDR